MLLGSQKVCHDPLILLSSLWPKENFGVCALARVQYPCLADSLSYLAVGLKKLLLFSDRQNLKLLPKVPAPLNLSGT